MHPTTEQELNDVLPLRTAKGKHLSWRARPEAIQRALKRLLNEHPDYFVYHIYSSDSTMYAVLRRKEEA